MAETEVKAVTFGQDVITTTVTSSGRAVERWISEVLSVHRPGGIRYDVVVGLDIEWRPNFRGPQNPTATLQLCVDRRCLIFQLLHADYLPVGLGRFLGDRTIRFFGVGVEADAERLRDDHGLEVANAVDLRGRVAEYMDRADLRQAGLRAIVGAVLGADLVKPRRVTMSRWDARRLSDEQIGYACIDAFVSSEVARKLQRYEQILGKHAAEGWRTN
ncbi:hypothetical protein SETIT_5G252200v2 [Setaria italica]|uniref:3'-5' exonuclease domain-containing protein n=1 Tax=Setaria italica TaxID=4555 RepID=A0A368R8L0_SETIT|nr:hypothetical protein SETIT_5G252200v2 [Setaria italica]